jgi:hypothetical protein
MSMLRTMLSTLTLSTEFSPEAYLCLLKADSIVVFHRGGADAMLLADHEIRRLAVITL